MLINEEKFELENSCQIHTGHFQKSGSDALASFAAVIGRMVAHISHCNEISLFQKVHAGQVHDIVNLI